MQPKLHSPVLFLLIIFFLSISIHPSFSLAKKCNPNDKKVLLEIKAGLDANDIVFSDWNLKNADCCSWGGVQCNAYKRVVSLNIMFAPSIEYNIPPAIGYLPYLTSLKISLFGKLSGEIPESLARLTNLQTLDLSGNNLTGQIPSSLGLLEKLTELDLSRNGLKGSIPASLGQLTSLTNLDLNLNKLSGPIPSTLGQLTSLTNLNLSSNHLSGPIPASLSHLTKVNTLDLRSNQLTGSIPASFGEFKNPKMSLSLSSNRLSGPLPRSFGQAHISSLDLSQNKLSGDASFLFGRDKMALDTIYLGANQFSFDFSNVVFPIGLRNLDISNNHIYGSLPKQLGQLPLQFLSVSHNLFCGPIPTGRRLKRFSPENFSHNKCLCGLPLPPCKYKN